jgi:ABC-type transport system involved in cytochrome c biogenesis permease component
VEDSIQKRKKIFISLSIGFNVLAIFLCGFSIGSGKKELALLGVACLLVGVTLLLYALRLGKNKGN